MTYMASVTRLEPGAPDLRDTTVAYLDSLAAAVTPLGMTASLIALPRRLPRLQIAHPDGLAEEVFAARCEDGNWWFWWPWAQRIAAVADLDEAVVTIERALKRSPQDSGFPL